MKRAFFVGGLTLAGVTMFGQGISRGNAVVTGMGAVLLAFVFGEIVGRWGGRAEIINRLQRPLRARPQ